MTKRQLLLLGLLVAVLLACRENEEEKEARTAFFPTVERPAEQVPKPANVWVFMLAGQSNMAGRGLVAPQDTVPHERILSINEQGELILAKEPLHFYERSRKMTGLDCGLSFGKAIIEQVPDSISVLLIPTAVGGSSISQWLGDSTHRDVQLLTNFKEKVAIGQQYGQLKAVLWHQGESDANPADSPYYKDRLSTLVRTFRNISGHEQLPILIGQLGSYSTNNDNWQKINAQIEAYVLTDSNALFITTEDLTDKGDKVHFDAAGQRIMGQRFADAYMKSLQ